MYRLIALLAGFACMIPTGIADAQAAGGQNDTVNENSFHVWAVGVRGGGVRRPPDTTCTPWQRANTSAEATTILEFEIDGTIWAYFTRECDETRQFAWVPQSDPESVARLLRDDIIRQIQAPAPTFGPPADLQIVNFETYLWMDPQPDIVEQGFIPGLTVTATATATNIVWEPDLDGVIRYPSEGSRDNRVECEPWGRPPAPDAPYVGDAECGWVPIWIGETNGSVSIDWDIQWRATNGQAGTLDPITVTTNYAADVGEIQTVGVSN